MNYTETSAPNDPVSWLYSSHTEMDLCDPLQEPGSFEDFKFSFGLDPDFSIPVPLDIPPLHMPLFGDDALDLSALPSTASTASPLSSSSSSSSATLDSFGISPSVISAPQNAVLDEEEQKAFSSFLDSFFVDNDIEPLPNHLPGLYDAPSEPPLPPVSGPFSGLFARDDDAEEERRTSILQSLDQSKRLQQRLNLLASLPNTPKPDRGIDILGRGQKVDPHLANRQTSPAYRASSRNRVEDRQASPSSAKRLSSDDRELDPPVTKRSRPHRDLLTEDEKRANHIASEQKRRSTIRNGFKELTDLIPTLKNINNSKSTVLFKAVDYIKYLEKRNKSLRDMVHSLEIRAQVQGHTGGALRWQANDKQASSTVDQDRRASSSDKSTDSPLPPAAMTALKTHKAQQQQLLQLQEQLKFHQRLLAQQEEMKLRAVAASSLHSQTISSG